VDAVTAKPGELAEAQPRAEQADDVVPPRDWEPGQELSCLFGREGTAPASPNTWSGSTSGLGAGTLRTGFAKMTRSSSAA
jgi:hypothetical protein